MLIDSWRSALVLGGIRSGKSEFAESLLRDVGPVRYVATAATPGAEPGAAETDPEWAARIENHRVRRPAEWSTEEVGDDPARLPALLAEAKPDETVLVDDLGGWVAGLLLPVESVTAGAVEAAVADLAAAVRRCPARVVLVSPEVGLSVVPATPLGRAFADALGGANQAVAGACDAVALVVAGQPTWLKSPSGEPAPARLAPTPVAEPALPEVIVPTEPEPARPARSGGGALTAPTMTLPMLATGLVIQPGMELPMPDEQRAGEVAGYLAGLDLPGAGFGELRRVVEFAAGARGRVDPGPWRSVRMLLIHGDHQGGAAAGWGPEEASRVANQARTGEGPYAALAARAGASLQVVDAATTAAMEEQVALDPAAVEAALRHGWRLAEQAVDSGVDLIVLGACGAGTDAAAAAVLAVATGAEPAAVLGRVVRPGGVIDDNAWMVRCATVRDAVHRMRHSSRGARDVLAEVGGADIAIATGVLLGATARRTPVLLDGPVGIAAALVSRDLAGQARHWCLLPDAGNHRGVVLGADILDLEPVLDLRMDLGEGTGALAALPLFQAALATVHALAPRRDPEPGRPAGEEPDPDPWEPGSEPEPDSVPAPDPSVPAQANAVDDLSGWPDGGEDPVGDDGSAPSAPEPPRVRPEDRG
ncbi:bifunctional adenosylcobinamide kinase/adenosylcobinamide-phosphate guanylyltransferase [Rhizomonospora bruguierae]|uniref:bifunctional adenosylcobinamide kinase/adenosylcobinamide-phosphate guanylyltransferase n=1 Tax=Rhizomonospora bruguierae TaxID=1581705 RepID=UPI001BCED970|nr:bifunctional adenosylcobinamide kinase/adenosylcobinamide-phosphate guanylyltransferase [Micromonospora sp. NBRC 107566]